MGKNDSGNWYIFITILHIKIGCSNRHNNTNNCGTTKLLFILIDFRSGIHNKKEVIHSVC